MDKVMNNYLRELVRVSLAAIIGATLGFVLAKIFGINNIPAAMMLMAMHEIVSHYALVLHRATGDREIKESMLAVLVFVGTMTGFCLARIDHVSSALVMFVMAIIAIILRQVGRRYQD